MKNKYLAAGGMLGVLCTTAFFVIVQNIFSSVGTYSSNDTSSSTIKYHDPYDQYAPLVEEDPIFIYLVIYKIKDPVNISPSLAKEDIFNEMRYVEDIWGQANIVLTTGYQEIEIEGNIASEIESGKIHYLENTLLSLSHSVATRVPIFIVKKLPNHAGYTVMENNRGKYIVVDENAFNKKGRTLAHEIGHYLGLDHPHDVTDQNEISGLMGNMGLSDISIIDISKAREVATRISDSQKN